MNKFTFTAKMHESIENMLVKGYSEQKVFEKVKKYFDKRKDDYEVPEDSEIESAIEKAKEMVPKKQLSAGSKIIATDAHNCLILGESPLRGDNIYSRSRKVSMGFRISQMVKYPLISTDDLGQELVRNLYIPCICKGEKTIFDILDWKLMSKDECEILLSQFKVSVPKTISSNGISPNNQPTERAISPKEYIRAWAGNGVPDAIFKIEREPHLIQEEYGKTKLNLFKGFPFAVRDDIFISERMRKFAKSFFTMFVHTLIADFDSEVAYNVISYFAQAFQEPDKRPHYLLDLHSNEGTGKGWLFEKIIGRIAGNGVRLNSTHTWDKLFTTINEPEKGSSVEIGCEFENTLFVRMAEGAIKHVGRTLKEKVSGESIIVKEKYIKGDRAIKPISRILADTNDEKSIDIKTLGTTRLYSVKCRDIETDPKKKHPNQNKFFSKAMQYAEKEWFLKAIYDLFMEWDLSLFSRGRASASAETEKQVQLANRSIIEFVQEIKFVTENEGDPILAKTAEEFYSDENKVKWVSTAHALSIYNKQYGGKLTSEGFRTCLKKAGIEVKEKVGNRGNRKTRLRLFNEEAEILVTDAKTENVENGKVTKTEAEKAKENSENSSVFDRILFGDLGHQNQKVTPSVTNGADIAI